MSDLRDKTYLGDGLYVNDDGFQIGLFAPRGLGDVHEVYLEDSVLAAFFDFIRRSRGLNITVTRSTSLPIDEDQARPTEVSSDDIEG
jgi:hypothetical protein